MNKPLKQVAHYLLLCLNILVLFISIFSARVELPENFQWYGKLHPAILHFPLSLLLVSTLLYLFRKNLRLEQNRPFIILFYLSAITASMSALSGLFLSLSGEYDQDLLFRHQWMGVSISSIAGLIYLGIRMNIRKEFFQGILIFGIPIVVLGSHWGGMLTHGTQFWQLDPEEQKETSSVISDSSVVYTAVIEPILKAKCQSCHNDQKSKGGLIMTSIEKLLKGGKNGPIWVAGDPLNSHIVERMELPEEDKKHMPPRGRTQLTDKEVILIKTWIQQGADLNKRIKDYPENDSLRILLAALFPPDQVQKRKYEFEAVSASVLASIQSPYCYISPVAAGSPALQVRFLIRSAFKPSLLAGLDNIAEQVVEINCGNMPLRDDDLRAFEKFQNLETLILNGSDITGEGLQYLKKCKYLHDLSVSNTAVDMQSIEKLGENIPSLKNVYCWNTVVDSIFLKKLTGKNPSIHWELGFRPDDKEILQLTTPQLVDNDLFVLGPGDSVRFKHPMPGVKIRYALDGQKPDSMQSPEYRKPLYFNRATRIRTIAVRSGWLTSDTSDHTFFIRSTYLPEMAKLIFTPDKSYQAQMEKTLLDGKKADPNNFREGALGYKETDFEIQCSFSKKPDIKEILISTIRNIGSYIMPPMQIEVWAGPDAQHLKKIHQSNPTQPTKYEPNRIDLFRVPFNGSYPYYRIRMQNVKILPKWHAGKGEKGWIFIDEIFFN